MTTLEAYGRSGDPEIASTLRVDVQRSDWALRRVQLLLIRFRFLRVTLSRSARGSRGKQVNSRRRGGRPLRLKAPPSPIPGSRICFISLERDAQINFGECDIEADFGHAEDRVVAGQQGGDPIVAFAREHDRGGLGLLEDDVARD